MLGLWQAAGRTILGTLPCPCCQTLGNYLPTAACRHLREEWLDYPEIRRHHLRPDHRATGDCHLWMVVVRKPSVDQHVRASCYVRRPRITCMNVHRLVVLRPLCQLHVSASFVPRKARQMVSSHGSAYPIASPNSTALGYTSKCQKSTEAPCSYRK